MGKKVTYIEAIRQAIDEEMSRDADVFLMGEDVAAGVFGATTGLVDKYGSERIRNTPISEAGFVGAGLGAAIAGSRPIVEIEFATMVYMCFDQLVNQIAKTRYMSGNQVNVPITLRTAAVMGLSAGAQHADTPHALFMHMPGLKLVLPSTPRDAKGLLKTSIRDDDPVLFIESMQLASTKEEVGGEEDLIPLGQAKVVREGTDLTLVGLGPTVPPCLAVAERLTEEGISAEVLDPRTLVPLDWPTLFSSVRKTGRLVVVDDATPLCSFASEIAAAAAEFCFDQLEAAPRRVTRENTLVPFSPVLEKHILVDEEKIAAACRSVLSMEGVR